MKKVSLTFAAFFLFQLFHINAFCSPHEKKMYGVTIDAVDNLSSIITSLNQLSVNPVTRIVFDEWQPASGYVDAVNQVGSVSKVMGEILDSYYMSQYSVQQFRDRVNEYANVLGDNVSIWEVGNEVNGEWLGNSDSTLAKVFYAFMKLKKAGKVTALTLYYNKDCWSNPENEMFTWINRIPSKMKSNLDYVLVSYYEDDCNNYQPNWQSVFDSLHVLFPNSKLGIGECGTSITSRKEEYINRYYRMNVTTPNYIGGYFWWYYKEDCIPFTRPLWSVLNNAINSQGTSALNNKINNMSIEGKNYPNPFNPVTDITYSVPNTGIVKITVYDIIGREVKQLINEYREKGNYTVKFDGTDLSSGVYIYRIQSSDYNYTGKMLLAK
jgi:hypothetical protein